MSIASVNRSLRAVEDSLPPLAAMLLSLPDERLAAWTEWRDASRAWHRAHPDAFERWIAGEIDPPEPPAGIFPEPPVLAVGDDAAAAWGDFLRGRGR